MRGFSTCAECGTPFLDVQIYNLYPFSDSNYNIVYYNRLLDVSFHMCLYCCILHFPLYSYIYFHVLDYISLRTYIYLYFSNMGTFLFSLSVGQLALPFFVLCLVSLLIGQLGLPFFVLCLVLIFLEV